MLIGDAAHTTTPHIACGVGMAIELSAWDVDPPDDPTAHHQLSGRALAALSRPL